MSTGHGASRGGDAPPAPDTSPGPGASTTLDPGAAPPVAAAGHPARSVLVELADLLEAERAALVNLDRDAIEDFANRKLELDQALKRAAGEVTLGAPERALLERVRQSALSNQLLLAHARSCVQGVLSLLSPENTPRYTAPGHSPPNAHAAADAPPLALNLRR